MHDAVGDWYESYGDELHRYVARRVGDDVAGDVVADSFRMALERFDLFDPTRGAPRAWLFGIATNLLRRHWRDEERRLRAHTTAGRAAPVAGDPLVAVDDVIDAARRVDQLVDAVCALSPEDRDVLVLTVWEGLSSAEVGDVLAIPAGTVRSRLNRIRLHLRGDERNERQGACRG